MISLNKMLWIGGGLLLADALTKIMLVTPQWAAHHHTTTWRTQAFVAIGIPIAFQFVRELRLAGVLLFAGGVGNLISALHGDVQNPFYTQSTSWVMAFNLADASIVLGFILMISALPSVAARLRKARQRAGVH